MESCDINTEIRLITKEVGQEITGKLFRPSAFETSVVVSLETGVYAVAIKLFPNVGDPHYSEPVVVLVSDADIENFIRAIRIAQAASPADLRQGLIGVTAS
jgi:hypothetical protein